jgi:hypothetical protein
MSEHDGIDQLVDAGLASYADPGPESGLEERVLARIAEECAPATRRRLLPWVIALPIAAGLLLMFVLSGPKHTLPIANHANQAPSPQQPNAATARARVSAVPHPRATAHTLAKPLEIYTNADVEGTVAKTASLPKLEVFPTPQPLTPEELAITVFAAKATEADRRSFIEAQTPRDAPLSIASIEIQPLNPPDHGGN